MPSASASGVRLFYHYPPFAVLFLLVVVLLLIFFYMVVAALHTVRTSNGNPLRSRVRDVIMVRVVSVSGTIEWG